MSRLDMLFRPAGVAIVGASANPAKLGNQILSNLISSGYQGGIYPVNPKGGEILDHTVYTSVAEIPGRVDQAVIVVPSRFVGGVLRDCGVKGIKGAVIISAGFREAGAQGREMEAELLEIAAQYGMRIVGPNCLGVMDMWTPLDCSFARNTTSAGHISFSSQSGALGTAVLDYALENHIGLCHFVSLGNKADIDEGALYDAWREEEHSKVIISYIEGIKDGPSFMKSARETARIKPIIAVKSGRTSSGSKAVSSHTGSLAGSDAAYDAAFMQSGVLRVNSVQELFDFATAFAYQPMIRGNRICIVTNAGGPGVMATDTLESNDLVLSELLPETKETLAAALPAAASTHNPVDVLGDATSELYRVALHTVLPDPNVDGVLMILTPQAGTDVIATARALVEEASKSDKPVFACWMGGHAISEAVELLAKELLPCYPFPEPAIDAFGAMRKYNAWRQQPELAIEKFDVDKAAVEELFARVRSEGRDSIGDSEAQAILKAYRITTPKSTVAATPSEAVVYCHEIGYPVVMKIASPDILHKSDVGGIIVGVNSDDQVREAFDTLMQRAATAKPDATLWGAQIQEMVMDAREIIIGMNRDPQFGPLVMFGLGGIYVEVLKDVTFRVAPMNRVQARQMVESIRSFKLLTGMRGQAPSDLGAMVDTILRISQLVTDFPEISELDINPLLVRDEGQGAVAVDMRLILE